MNARAAAWALAVLGVTLAPVPAEPQAHEQAARALTRQASEPRDIGVLFAGTTTFLGGGGLMAGKPPAFSQRLRELGYVDGQDIAIRFLSAESRADRLPDLAQDLVEDGVSVIVAIGDQAVEAARHATKTIPIVMAPSGNPVRSGFVGDLARPAGNVTGLATAMPNSHATRLRTLKEIVPTMSRVAVIWNAGDPAHALALADLRTAASEMAGTTLHSVEVHRPTDLARVVAALAPGRADALVGVGDPFSVPYRAWIMTVMTTSRLPAIFEERDFVEEGGLISYGPRHPELWRRAAHYVDRILKGARPQDLPVEQPQKFELVINMRTARALGLAIPPALRARADQVIE